LTPFLEDTLAPALREISFPSPPVCIEIVLFESQRALESPLVLIAHPPPDFILLIDSPNRKRLLSPPIKNTSPPLSSVEGALPKLIFPHPFFPLRDSLRERLRIGVFFDLASTLRDRYVPLREFFSSPWRDSSSSVFFPESQCLPLDDRNLSLSPPPP